MMRWLFLCVFISPSSCIRPVTLDVKINSITDKQSLLDFKKSLSSDPLNVLHKWLPAINICNWTGVGCDSAGERVTSLKLPSIQLEGSISRSLGKLSFLTHLDLYNNSFGGQIPPELGRLKLLEVLFLTRNSLQGFIPKSLHGCIRLEGLYLATNRLTGPIPAELSQLTNLKNLRLGFNNLSGKIPPSLANLTHLETLIMADNYLEGHIPSELGRLTQLETFFLFENPRLTGPIPSSLSNISGLVELALYSNNLTGGIPPELGKLSRLVTLYLWNNKLSGTIPTTLANCSQLSRLDLELNHLNGAIPLELSRLEHLQFLSLSSNQLVSGSNSTIPILADLSNSTQLNEIWVHDNRLTGSLPQQLPTNLSVLLLKSNFITGNVPSQIANLSNLRDLDLSFNHLAGHIPASLRRLKNLQRLRLDSNQLAGNIPTEMGEIANLGLLSMSNNMLSGEIPHALARLRELRTLILHHNQLSGHILASLCGCYKLKLLDLSNNNFRRGLPREVASLPNLQFYFNLSSNFLQGSLPPEIGKMIHVQSIDISFNRLEGQIPATLESCQEHPYLMLSSNSFQGTIPKTLSSLKSLESMDLSSNNLSGSIPLFLKSLHHLNLYFNNLSGVIPEEGVFRNMTAASFIGNPFLCGEWKQFPPCPLHTRALTKDHTNTILIFAVVAGAVALLSCFSTIFGLIYCRRKKKYRLFAPEFMDNRGISYEEVIQSTEGVCQENLLGTSSSGSVYRGVMGDGRMAAFKLLNTLSQQARKSFIRECKVLREVRHRNLVKIISFCAEFVNRVLVLEFMSKGNLEKPLKYYSQGNGTLSFKMILNIAIDVIHGLEYLHHDCFVQIIHRDIKPSNILLDEDMTAHVADFGIARMIYGSDSAETGSTSTLAVKGSMGYIAPEYGIGGEPSTKGDVYSYGIMLLQMITGRKSPADDEFGGELNLPNWVQKLFPERTEEIVDKNMVLTSTSDYELSQGVEPFIRI
ncbi:hypothetical protein KI387_029171, partial [Taxus chinensis]